MMTLFAQYFDELDDDDGKLGLTVSRYTEIAMTRAVVCCSRDV